MTFVEFLASHSAPASIVVGATVAATALAVFLWDAHMGGRK